MGDLRAAPGAASEDPEKSVTSFLALTRAVMDAVMKTKESGAPPVLALLISKPLLSSPLCSFSIFYYILYNYRLERNTGRGARGEN